MGNAHKKPQLTNFTFSLNLCPTNKKAVEQSKFIYAKFQNSRFVLRGFIMPVCQAAALKKRVLFS